MLESRWDNPDPLLWMFSRFAVVSLGIHGRTRRKAVFIKAVGSTELDAVVILRSVSSVISVSTDDDCEVLRSEI
jgi:hypothetical protein